MFGGDYVLQTVNGKLLPYTWTFTGGNYYRLNSYRISVIPGGSWLSAIDYTYTDRGQVVNQPSAGETGTFVFTESTGFVSLISRDGTTFFSGNVSGDVMTATNNGDVYVFKR